jgi:hypothetical protein
VARAHRGVTRAWKADQRRIEQAKWDALGEAMRALLRRLAQGKQA